MKLKNVEDIYPLSSMQQGLLFHSLYSAEASVYHQQLSCILQGDLNVTAFERVWQSVVDRHSSLRTAFVWGDFKEPLQIVRRSVHLPCEKLDWRAYSSAEQQTQLEAFIHADQVRGFDLSKAPLLRLALLRLAHDEYHCLFSFHHLLLDGWSLSLVLKEVFISYDAITRNAEAPLDPPYPYRDYIAWLQQRNLTQAEEFWRETLRGFSAPTPLVVDQRQTTHLDKAGQYVDQIISLSETTTKELQQLARQHLITMNTLLEGAWALLLSRYSDRDDILFGTVVSGRSAELPGVDSRVGLFINTLPVRIRVPATERLLAWLKRLQEQQGVLHQYEYTPLMQIQSWSEFDGNMPLFESLLVFENYPIDSVIQTQFASMNVRNVQALERTNYPITVVAIPGSTFTLRLIYDLRRFDTDTIERLLGHLRIILESFITLSDPRLADISLLTAAERHLLLTGWNKPTSQPVQEGCIHHLFEAQAQRTPDNIAIKFGDQQLTYAGLNRQANQLAYHLQACGVGPEVRVAICMERSLEVVIAILAVLKAGGVYVPIDMLYPQKRISFMLADAQVSVLITQPWLRESLPEHTARVISLDPTNIEICKEPETNPVSLVTHQNLAYVTYTSGSTGVPKGVSSVHAGVVNYLTFITEAYNLNAQDIVLQLAALSFDASVRDIIGPLISGAQVVLVNTDAAKDPVALLAQIKKHQVTCLLSVVPTMLRVLLSAARNHDIPYDSLRLILTSGENLYLADCQKAQQVFGAGVRVVNQYGPTECTMTSSYHVVDTTVTNHQIALIGRPIANANLYILDGEGQLAPIGVPGRLYIGGMGVTRGYLNRPELTADRFIPHPFSTMPGAQLYDTGDLARYLSDGTLEFLGRMDSQVKIRGVRVELGEIEGVLRHHPSIREVAVVAHEGIDDDKRLLAYVAPKAQNAPTIAGQDRYLLPNNMAIVHRNTYETDFFYSQIFEEHTDLKHGITIHDGDCIFDVGANIGLFTLFVNQLADKVSVFAFEPIPPIFEALRINTNLYAANTKIFQHGLSDEMRIVEFTYYPQSSCQSGYYADVDEDMQILKEIMLNQHQNLAEHTGLTDYFDKIIEDRAQQQTFICETKTISSVIQQHQIERIDLLKIDTEKSEYEILMGINDLDWLKIRQIVIEAHNKDGQIQKIVELLEVHDYSVVVEQDLLLKGTNIYNIYALQKHVEKQFVMPTLRNSHLISDSLPLSESDLRNYLRDRLPDSLIPSAFIMLEELPRTPNGKLDIRSLPAVKQIEATRTAAYVAPVNEFEKVIVLIWQQVLGIDKVGMHDNFFDIGGNSLSMLRIQSSLHEKIKRDISLVDLFTYPTISALAYYLTGAQSEQAPLDAKFKQAESRSESARGRRKIRQAQHLSSSEGDMQNDI
jgi:amino acid adenylation domain-containing protein/FkbM family methyltransferase